MKLQDGLYRLARVCGIKYADSMNPGWRYVGLNTDERDFVIDGVNVWQHKWAHISSGQVVLRDPCYFEPKTLDVYTITADEKTIKFAAGEVSNGVYLFFVPDDQKRDN